MSSSKKKKDSLKAEIILIVVLGLALLLFLGNFGWAGLGDTGFNWLSNRLKGLLGMTEYIAPLCLGYAVLFCYFHYADRRLSFKISFGVAAILLFTVLISLLCGKDHMEWKWASYFEEGMKKFFTGGAIGGMLASFLYQKFGMTGSFVIVLLLFVIDGVALTEKSLIGQVQQLHQKETKTRRAEREPKKRTSNGKRKSPASKRASANRTERAESNKGSRTKNNEKDAEYAGMIELKKASSKKKPIRKKQERTPVCGTSLLTLKEESKSKPFTNLQPEDEVHEVFSEGDFISYMQEEDLSSCNKADTEQTIVSQQEEAHHKSEDKSVISHAENQNLAKDSGQSGVQTAEYQKPSLALLKKGAKQKKESKDMLTKTGKKLQQTLQSFGVNVTMTNVSCGPSVTRYELQPEQGVKVSKIVNLADDIKLNLAVSDIRIEAPIPGKAAVGIEVPNQNPSAVLLRDLLESKEFQDFSSPLTFAVGKNISGQVIVADIAKMPHLLIAGATGAGKSVCINTLIMSLLYKANPDEVKLIMVDPKVVELSVYNGIPHMMIPVVTDPKKAAGALNWAVGEMGDRYKKFADMNVRDLKGYNEKIASLPESDDKPNRLPQIVIIVDELADLMMVSKNEVEDAICRLAQLARAAGIHLIIATQRPSVDVITGLIKANMPSRIAFAVSSGVDSRTIIDINGAEKLLGKGDMLFYPSGFPKPMRVQGAFVSDQEVSDVTGFLSQQNQETVYNEEIEEKMNQSVMTGPKEDNGTAGYDEYFAQAGKFVIEKDKASISMLQRVFKIGFNRAARIMDQLEEAGVVGAEEGTKTRKILMSMEEFELFIDEAV